MKEALKLALEALELALSDDQPYIVKCGEAITAIKEALAQPEQKHPLQVKVDRDKAWSMRETNCGCDHNEYCEKCWPPAFRKGGYWDQQEALAQPEERDFCPRCGKRTADLTLVHTCTPPIAADPKAFHGFPSGSVSTPNAGGKCVTDGETSPIAELWAALTAYQPHADTCGHGKSWRKMCEARTKDAAGAAVSHAVVCASSTNVAADAAHIVWAGGDLGVAVAKIKSITR